MQIRMDLKVPNEVVQQRQPRISWHRSCFWSMALKIRTQMTPAEWRISFTAAFTLQNNIATQFSRQTTGGRYVDVRDWCPFMLRWHDLYFPRTTSLSLILPCIVLAIVIIWYWLKDCRGNHPCPWPMHSLGQQMIKIMCREVCCAVLCCVANLPTRVTLKGADDKRYNGRNGYGLLSSGACVIATMWLWSDAAAAV